MRLPAMTWTLIGGLLLAGACGNSGERRICDPGVPSGRIVGRVESGRLNGASVRASSVGAAGAHVEIGAPVDTLGRFAVIVPAGKYRLRLEGSEWMCWYSAAGADDGYQSRPDTLSLAAGDSVVAVFRLATLAVQVSTGDDYPDGTWVDLIAYSRGESGVDMPIDHAGARST